MIATERVHVMFRFIAAVLLCAVGNGTVCACVHDTLAAKANERLSTVQIKTLVQSVIDTILKEHIDPPTRQQLVLEVLRELTFRLDKQVSLELASVISDARHREELYDFFETEARKLVGSDAPSTTILGTVQTAIDRVLLGGFECDTRSAVQAEEQIAANRYVGIGVVISSLGKGHGSQFNNVFEDGPAANAGILVNDLLDAVDGKSTKDMPLVEVIQLLRGPAESSVKLTVRTEKQPSRDLTLVRRIVPLKSLEVIEKNVRERALHIRVDRFSASSLSELRNIVSKAEEGGDRLNTIVLNIQNTVTDNLHNFHLFADGLLDETTFCKVQTRKGIRTLKTEEGKALDERRVVILYQLGYSEALDLIAQACVEAGIAVYYWFPNLEKARERTDAIILPNRESFEVKGTDYFIKFPTSRLLDKNGKRVSHGPPIDGKQDEAKGRLHGTPLLKQQGSILDCILLELAP